MKQTFDRKSFWSYISSFWSHLSESDKISWESFWTAINDVGENIFNKAQRLKLAADPTNTEYDIKDCIDIEVGILKSIAINIDPTQKATNSYIIPKRTILQPPVFDGQTSEYFDLIELSETDFYKIIDIAKDQYVVIIPDNTNLPTKYFKIKDMLENNELTIQVYGDLRYLGIETFKIYLTTSKAYSFSSEIMSIPFLQNKIDGSDVIYYKDIDYKIYDNVIEFESPIVEEGVLYCPTSDIIEEFLFVVHSNLGISNWKDYNFNNFLAKGVFSSLINAMKDLDTYEKYTSCLNAYYGLPICPEEGDVVGLYESYAYEIESIDSENHITLKKKETVDLHPFIQVGSIFQCSDATIRVVEEITSRSDGIIKLGAVIPLNPSDLTTDITLNLELKNRYDVINFNIAEGENNQFIIIEAIGMYEILTHIINIYNDLYNGKILPEIMIYGNKQDYLKSEDYRGIYHITSVESLPVNQVKIYLYEKSNEEALYHDFIPSSSSPDAGDWYMHFPWPTHKCLLIYLSSGVFFPAYIDSNVDTIFDVGDKILAYQPIARNISMANNKMIENWNEFEYLKRESEPAYPINILEMFGVIPGAIPGSYFPVKCINNG